MKSFAGSLALFLLALAPVAFATEEGRSTVYITSTVKKVTTHTVTASVYHDTEPTSVYSSEPTSSVVYEPSSSSSSSVVHSSEAPTYTYTSHASSYKPSGGSQVPTTIASTYLPPAPTATQTPAPTGAAGQVGANVLLAGVVAGVGALML